MNANKARFGQKRQARRPLNSSDYQEHRLSAVFMVQADRGEPAGRVVRRHRAALAAWRACVAAHRMGSKCAGKGPITRESTRSNKHGRPRTTVGLACRIEVINAT